MKKLIRACIALAAFGALFVIPSVASAAGPELTAPTGTPLPVGSAIIGTNTITGVHKPTVMTTSIGNVECTGATMEGTLLKNTGTHVEGEITTAEFGGTVGGTTTGHCSGSGFLASPVVTPSHTSNPSIAGAPALPWCITASGNKDEFTVRGGKCSEASRPLRFLLHASGTQCAYEKASVTGTYLTHPNHAVLTIASQTFTKVAGGSFFCPSSGTLHMSFTLETAKGEDIYIS